jgi:hypothetical protein
MWMRLRLSSRETSTFRALSRSNICRDGNRSLFQTLSYVSGADLAEQFQPLTSRT